ncbi:MAG: hypothetical protein JJU37_11635 [Balneolaceae bacterium]|nr:hypothetical protein [Balneolaceae bacterium]
MKKFQTNISTYKKFPALLATLGLLFIVLHPLEHAAETFLFESDTVHHELPADKKNDTTESDCIECVLVTSMVTDCEPTSVILQIKSDYISATEFSFLKLKQADFGFSLRAPPHLYV